MLRGNLVEDVAEAVWRGADVGEVQTNEVVVAAEEINHGLAIKATHHLLNSGSVLISTLHRHWDSIKLVKISNRSITDKIIRKITNRITNKITIRQIQTLVLVCR